MSIKTRIISTLFTATLVAGAVGVAMPAHAGAVPDEKANPPHCTHGCGGGGGNGFEGPDDLTSEVPDPGDPGGTTVDVPIPASATFTG